MTKSLYIVFLSFILIAIIPSVVNAQFSININRQLNKNLTIEQLNKQKEKIKTREKEALKKEINIINNSLKKGTINEEIAEQKKREAAIKHAKNIKNQLDIIDANIELIGRNRRDNSDYYRSLGYLDPKRKFGSGFKEKLDITPNRTQLGVYLSFGINNAIGPQQSLDNSPYKIGNSGFFDFGFELRTALTKNGFVRLNYGIGFQFNNLHPSDNLYFAKIDEITILEEFNHELKKSKLGLNNIIIPVHFEIGKVNSQYRSTGFRFGLGGYLGFNMSAVQTIKYKESGHKVKERIVNNYNTNNFIYGLDVYFGWRWITLYVKYDLNTIFSHNLIEEHDGSIGIRLML